MGLPSCRVCALPMGAAGGARHAGSLESDEADLPSQVSAAVPEQSFRPPAFPSLAPAVPQGPAHVRPCGIWLRDGHHVLRGDMRDLQNERLIVLQLYRCLDLPGRGQPRAVSGRQGGSADRREARQLAARPGPLDEAARAAHDRLLDLREGGVRHREPHQPVLRRAPAGGPGHQGRRGVDRRARECAALDRLDQAQQLVAAGGPRAGRRGRPAVQPEQGLPPGPQEPLLRQAGLPPRAEQADTGRERAEGQ
mmetsp:Transcript_72850/g.206061  ORF Transcript_72850/g.206061 Transcript_72850/m.206061 type:complete len:251 (-) Transcript_72850:442-1194(-)